MMRLGILLVMLQAAVAGVAAAEAGAPAAGKAGGAASGGATIAAEEYPFPAECGQVEVWTSMTCTHDGQVLVGVCRSNVPSKMLQFDERSRRYVAVVGVDSVIDDSKWRVKQAKIHTQLLELPDGWVYGGTHCSQYDNMAEYEGGHWFRYDPRSHKMEDLGLGMAHEGLIAMQADAANHCLYGITYPGAYLLRFDMGGRKTQVLGKTSMTTYVDRYFQVLSNGIVCANQVRSGRGRMGGIYLFDLQTEKETVAYPVLLRRQADGSYGRDKTEEAPRIYNQWIAGTQNASGSVAYIASQASGHLITVHAAGEGDVAIYDRGALISHVAGPEGVGAGAAAGAGSSPGELCHALAMDLGGDVLLTLTIGGDVDKHSGKEQTHLMRYEPASDRFSDLGRIRTVGGKDLTYSVAMSITSGGVVYVVGSTGGVQEMRLFRLTGDAAARRDSRALER